MANVTTSYLNADKFGIASFEQMDTYLMSVLLAGPNPEFEPNQTFPVLLADSTTLAQFSVVGVNASGKLVLLTYAGLIATDGTKITPLGILAHGAVSGASNTTIRGQVIYAGCFALEGPLVWGAGFDTDAKKVLAFRGAPTPTNIVVRSRYTPTDFTANS